MSVVGRLRSRIHSGLNPRAGGVPVCPARGGGAVWGGVTGGGTAPGGRAQTHSLAEQRNLDLLSYCLLIHKNVTRWELLVTKISMRTMGEGGREGPEAPGQVIGQGCPHQHPNRPAGLGEGSLESRPPLCCTRPSRGPTCPLSQTCTRLAGSGCATRRGFPCAEARPLWPRLITCSPDPAGLCPWHWALGALGCMRVP